MFACDFSAAAVRCAERSVKAADDADADGGRAARIGNRFRAFRCDPSSASLLDAVQKALVAGGPVVGEISQAAIAGVVVQISLTTIRWRASYDYLVESIRKHPSQLELLSQLAMAGFKSPTVRDMTFGVVAVHSGYK